MKRLALGVLVLMIASFAAEAQACRLRCRRPVVRVAVAPVRVFRNRERIVERTVIRQRNVCEAE